MRRQLLQLLSDGELHSGEFLGRRLGVTRAAVWKQLRALAGDWGIRVEAVRSKGYRLDRPLELLDSRKIRSALPAGAEGYVREIVVHETIDSTNSWLLFHAGRGEPGGIVCLAEGQSAGRGRRGRAWLSPYGSNIYLSVLWRYGLPPVALNGLSLACGVAVARALEQAGAADLALKWPNDLLWRRRKLAGLLLEVRGEVTGPSYVVAGVGVNIHISLEDGEKIGQPWAALDQLPGGSTGSRNALAALVAAELVAVMDQFGTVGLAPFLAEWACRDYLKGERVTLISGKGQVVGDYLGVSANGCLRLSVAGRIAQYNAGEVSVCHEDHQ